MAKDSLNEFSKLHKKLLAERAKLGSRLKEISEALGATPSTDVSQAPVRRKRRSALSLKEAVVRVTSKSPLSKEDILKAIGKIGYQFTAKDPMNSLNVVLYSKNPKFKRDNGLFSPA